MSEENRTTSTHGTPLVSLKLAPIVAPPSPQDREAWAPSWECYCCEDSGYVVRPECVLSDNLPTPQFNRPILCVRVGCNAREKVCQDPDMIDDRLTPAHCDLLHKQGKNQWGETLSYWHGLRQERRALDPSFAATLAQSVDEVFGDGSDVFG